MAINYGNLFEDVGEYIERDTEFAAVYSTLDAGQAEVEAQLSANSILRLYDGVPGAFSGFKGSVQGWRNRIRDLIRIRLTDKETVRDELSLSSGDLNTVLAALIKDMLTNAQSVDASTVTIGVPTRTVTNSTAGYLFFTTKMDSSSPASGVLPNINYAGTLSELAYTETMTLTCVRDDPTDRTGDARESFSWVGDEAVAVFSDNAYGSGVGPTIQPLNAVSILSNLEFETFSSNAPGSWTIDTGTTGTHIDDETTNIYRGTTALKLLGDGALSAIQLTQAPAASNIVPKRLYCVTAWIKGTASMSAGTLTIQFEGTGYTAGALTNEVQTVQISGTPTGGTYTLTFEGQTTGNIAFDATSATVQTALRLLKGLENVVVATGAGSPPDVTHTITYHGLNRNVAQITADITNLTGGTPAKAEATTTPGVAGEQIVLTSAALAGAAYGIKHFFVLAPIELPSDWELVIKLTGTPSAHAVYIDGMTFGPVTYHGGVGVALAAGTTKFIRGDKFVFSVTNDEAGIFQGYFRDAFRVQLPSNSAGAETIADTLATD